MRDAGALAHELREAGFAADIPVAVVQRVSCPEQRHVITRLDRMAADIADAGLSSPAVIVIGHAVSLADAGAMPAPASLAA
jgi:uroporphyrin-III C-methyltransferase